MNALHKEQLVQSEKFKNELQNGDFGEDSDTELENEQMITNDDHEADPLMIWPYFALFPSDQNWNLNVFICVCSL